MGERVEAVKIAYFTKELNLTSEEAQKFWPLYNTYFEELKKARTDNQSDELAFEEKALSVRKKYKSDFQKVLGSEERVNRIYTLERNFRDILRRELQERRGMGPGPGGREPGRNRNSN